MVSIMEVVILLVSMVMVLLRRTCCRGDLRLRLLKLLFRVLSRLVCLSLVVWLLARVARVLSLLIFMSRIL